MPTIKIIHDNDHNLVYEDVTFWAYREIMRQCGIAEQQIPGFDDMQTAYRGKRYDIALNDLENKFSFKVEDRFSSYKEAYELCNVEAQKEHLRMLPLVKGTLALLHYAGIPQCICTNNSRLVVEQAHRQTGLMQYLEGIISGDDAPDGRFKPDPWLVHSAMARLSGDPDAIIPSEFLQGEDSVSGLLSAKNAGIPDRNILWHTYTIPQESFDSAREGFLAKGLNPVVAPSYSGLLELAIERGQEIGDPAADKLDFILDTLSARSWKQECDRAMAAASYVEEYGDRAFEIIPYSGIRPSFP